MTDTPTTGGTVRYHRADIEERLDAWLRIIDPEATGNWALVRRDFAATLERLRDARQGLELLWDAIDRHRVFVTNIDMSQVSPLPCALIEGNRLLWANLKRVEGEAMGLTPPEPAPAPFVVTCNGHSVELDGDAVDELIRGWAGRTFVVDTPFATAMVALANLFRDARQELQPEQDDTASGIDFDALPIGTALSDNNGDLWVRLDDGWQCSGYRTSYLDSHCKPYTGVYQPAPLSPGEHLRGLLAGRDDADELIEYAAKWWVDLPDRYRPDTLCQVIGDAAREVHR